MKFTIEVPEWAKERTIYIMAGPEIMGVVCDGTLWMKTVRCNLCGKCCLVDEDFPLGVKSGDEVGWSADVFVCKFLKKEIWHFEPFNGATVYVCTAGAYAPFTCNIGPSPVCGREHFKENLPDCVLEYEKVDV